MNTLNNRSRRIARRLREAQSEIKSIDLRCKAIANDEDLTQDQQNVMINALRARFGELHGFIRRLQDRVGELANYVTQGAPRPLEPEPIRIASLSRTDSFPAAELRRRDGKCGRAWRLVQEAYAA